jgi:polyisoprenoid-binding protein YceI
MTNRVRHHTGSLALAIALAFLPGVAGADTLAGAGTARWQVAQAKVSVSGTSTLHDWTMTSTAATGEVTIPAGLLAGPPAEGTASGNFTVAVTSLASGKDRMDRIAHESLGAPKQPRITLELRRVTVTGPHAQGGIAVTVAGVMTVAGKPREIQLPMQVRRDGERLRAVGSAPLKMTDFGIEPPTAMMGTLHTGDAIVVTLDATLKPVP